MGGCRLLLLRLAGRQRGPVGGHGVLDVEAGAPDGKDRLGGEASHRLVLEALGLPGAEAVGTYATVMVSSVASGDAEASTALGVVRRWQPDHNRLAAAALVRAIGDRRVGLETAEAELDRVEASVLPASALTGVRRARPIVDGGHPTAPVPASLKHEPLALPRGPRASPASAQGCLGTMIHKAI
jgi:hypothetical protein